MIKAQWTNVMLYRCLLKKYSSKVSLDDMSISDVVRASDNIFEYYRQFRVASFDLGAIFGEEYSDLQG